MKNQFLIALFFITAFTAFGQGTITIKGKIIEKRSLLPVESATIYIKSAKDSTVIDYTISDRNGNLF